MRLSASSPRKIGSRSPTVSVVIKAYNHAAYIGQTIESVLSQSFQDFEILITDDASTDGTSEVVRAFSDPRIKLEILPTNTGVSRAMNATCQRATGRYLAILNSDDYALPGRLSAQVDYLDRHPDTGVVFTSVTEVGEHGDAITPSHPFKEPERWADHTRSRWLRHFFTYGNCLCAPSAMMRSRSLKSVGRYDPRLTNLQDLDMWVRFAMRSGIGFIPKPLTAFRVRNAARNLSAGRPDTVVRSQFEYSMILRWYADMDMDLFRDIFDDNAHVRSVATERQKRLFLAERALEVGHAPHRMFGLETYFAAATEAEDFKRLRALASAIDVFRCLDDAVSRCGLGLRGGPPDRFGVNISGRTIFPAIEDGSATFVIPAGTHSVYLVSPVRPKGPNNVDTRDLGVAIYSISVENEGEDERPIDLEDPALTPAFYALEASDTARWRWTQPITLLPREWYMGFRQDVTVRLRGIFNSFGFNERKPLEWRRDNDAG